MDSNVASPHGFYHLFAPEEKPKPGSLESKVQFIINVDDAAPDSPHLRSRRWA